MLEPEGQILRVVATSQTQASRRNSSNLIFTTGTRKSPELATSLCRGAGGGGGEVKAQMQMGRLVGGLFKQQLDPLFLHIDRKLPCLHSLRGRGTKGKTQGIWVPGYWAQLRAGCLMKRAALREYLQTTC